MRLAPLALPILLALGACSSTEPDDPPPPPPGLPVFEGERRVAFEAVAGFPPGSLLDIAFDGALSAAVVLNGGTSTLWLDDGSGWRALFDSEDQDGTITGPTAVCFAPGGELFVGGANAYFWRVGRDGAVLQQRGRFNVVGTDREVGDWPVTQCGYAGGRLFVSFANAIGSDGAMLVRPADFSRPSDWDRPRMPFRPATRDTPTEVDMAVYGLRTRVVGSFTEVVAGITYGASRPTLTAHTITGQLQYGEWVSDWLERDRPDTILPYGPPRAFTGTEALGEAVLFRRDDSGLWRVLVTPPPGHREPFGYAGFAILDAPELRGSVRAVGVDPAGHLWAGGDAMQTMRSTAPLR